MRETDSLKSISRAMEVLALFAEGEPELGVTDISKLLQMSKSTVHRILVSLEAGGLLRQSRSSQKYALGFRILELATALTGQLDIHRVAITHMQQLREQTNETVGLHILQGYNRICIAQLEGGYEIRRVYKELGTPLPLYVGAPGKAILAFLSEVEFDQVLASYDPAMVRIPLDKEVLQSQLNFIRRHGYIATVGERKEGITSIAGPVFQQGSQVVGCVNVTGPAFRFDEDRTRKYGQMVRAATHSISLELGHKNNQYPSATKPGVPTHTN